MNKGVNLAVSRLNRIRHAGKSERARSSVKSSDALWNAFLANPSQWWEITSNKANPNDKDSTAMGIYSQHAWAEGRSRPAIYGAPVRATYDPRLESEADPRDAGRVARRDWEIEVGTLSSRWEEGELSEVIEALDLLVQHRCAIDNSLFYRVLRRCIARNDLDLGRRVHALAIRSGYQANAFLANHIICMYASHGLLEEAMQVFTKVSTPNTYMWASIILAHARHGRPEQAIKLYQQMRQSTVKPDNHTFVAVLKACATAGDLASGREVHADILGSEDEPDIFVQNCLVDMYAKCGSLGDASTVFDSLPTQDVVTWNAMITGYAKSGRIGEARRMFDNLPTKDVVTWNAMIGGYARYERGQEALTLYACMQQGDVTPDHVTFSCLLQACASVGSVLQGKQLHAEIQQRGLEAHVDVGRSLVDMYAKCGSLEDARELFDRLPTKTVVTWNAMIAGYSQHGLSKEALSLYARMQQKGITPADAVTFVCLLHACASIGALHEGKQLHAHIQQRGLEAHVDVGSSLVNMYAKCGSLRDACTVFDRLPTRNLVTWNAMITGYAQQGYSQDALTLYGRMQEEGAPPADRVTFMSLLQACASAGALHQGKQIHERIQERGLETDVLVGNRLVDMYVKCGTVEDARRVLDRLPGRDVVTWNTLLNGYAEHGDGKKAIQCFEEMRKQGLQPDDTTFSCLLVACSHEGLVTEGQRYFEMMVGDHGIAPSPYHHNCMVDLLGRSGHLDEAEKLLQNLPCGSDAVGWKSLLTACRGHGDIERGRRCFDRLIALEPENAVAYVLLANIYANAGRWKDVGKIESLRKSAGAKKKPAKAGIEVNNRVHEFIIGEEKSDVSSKLKSLNMKLKKEGGHVPHTELVLKPMSEQGKEDALCGHAEKLALAYGLLNTPDGSALLVTKNLRMCDDCHSSTKIMSRLEKRDIIVRDAHRVHHFVDGSCSCGDRH